MLWCPIVCIQGGRVTTNIKSACHLIEFDVVARIGRLFFFRRENLSRHGRNHPLYLNC
jgi:hypothetical protein